MEDIYENCEVVKDLKLQPLTNAESRSTRRYKSFHLGIFVFLVFLSLFLLAGLITFALHYGKLAAELQITKDKVSCLIEERNRLNVTLSEETKELMRIQASLKQKKICPEGWTMFRCSCYLVSTQSGSWLEGREDCKQKEADLVVIESQEEQTFLSEFTKKAWIGLSDREEEGSWKWVDGSPLTLAFWETWTGQPDNGGGDPKYGEEDCAHNWNESPLWNDFPCSSSLQWICEK